LFVKVKKKSLQPQKVTGSGAKKKREATFSTGKKSGQKGKRAREGKDGWVLRWGKETKLKTKKRKERSKNTTRRAKNGGGVRVLGPYRAD